MDNQIFTLRKGNTGEVSDYGWGCEVSSPHPHLIRAVRAQQLVLHKSEANPCVVVVGLRCARDIFTCRAVVGVDSSSRQLHLPRSGLEFNLRQTRDAVAVTGHSRMPLIISKALPQRLLFCEVHVRELHGVLRCQPLVWIQEGTLLPTDPHRLTGG